MKKLILIISLFLCISPMAFAALDGSFDYLNIPTENIGALQFRKDTIDEVKTKLPNFKKSQLDDGQTILIYQPKNSIYSDIRVGFGQSKLEWIEFVLKEKAPIDEVLARYGQPYNINQKYHPIYDYYDYNTFNISSDKKGEYLYSITLFDAPKMPVAMQEINTQLPDWKDLNHIKTFIPGNYLEATFADDFDCLYPKFNPDESKTYTINKNLTNKYEKADFVFKNGILKRVILYPQNLQYSKITTLYGKAKNYQIKKELTIHEHGNFSVVTDLKNNVVKIIL